MPNGHQAVVDIRKLQDYSLNPDHPEGKHKARVFASALGLTQQDADWLRDTLLHVARGNDARLGRLTPHGQRYEVDFTTNRHGRTARLRSVWNIRPGENWPRLVTCYML